MTMRQLGEEHEELRDAVRALLAREEGAAAWGPLVEQIGAAALAVPERYGGAGAGALEVHVVQEELGRALSPVPFLGSAVFSAQAVLSAGDEAGRERLLPRIAEGAVVAIGWAEQGSWDLEGCRTQARAAAGEWRLTGRKEHVLDGAGAESLLVVARSGEGLGLFEVDPGADGVAVEAVPTMDLTRDQASVVLDGAPARLVGAGPLGPALDAAVVALAGEQVGAAAEALERTVRYATERVQFGRAIGSFQAVKHRLADGYVRLESARSTALAAASALDSSAAEASAPAAAAASACAEAFSWVAGEMIQLHGGIAITWEHDAHRYFKRAHGSSELLGSPRWHRGRLARGLELA
jgi:hypothetical protein